MSEITENMLREILFATAEHHNHIEENRFFHHMPALFFSSPVIAWQRKIIAYLDNKEAKEHLTAVDLCYEELADKTGVVIVPESAAEKRPRCGRSEADKLMHFFDSIIGKAYDDARDKWERLKPNLDSYYIDQANQKRKLVERKNYIVSCGYEPIGEIREKLDRTKTNTTARHHSSPQVVERGFLFNRVQYVPTSSENRSETDYSYEYWQEYRLRGDKHD